MSGRAFIFVCYFLSGLSALIYEIVWSRQLLHVFGATLYAVSTVVAVFLGGLALGAFACGQWLGGRSRSKCSLSLEPLTIYALLELGIGITALLTTLSLSTGFLQSLWLAACQALPASLSLALRFFLVAGAIAVPTALMGATFPVLSEGFAARKDELNEDVGFLYGANCAGAVAGCVLAGFFFLPAFGLTASADLAAAINFGLFSLVFLLRRQISQRLEPVVPEAATASGAEGAGSSLKPWQKNKPPEAAPPLSLVAALAFAAGLLALALQIAWTRLFSLLFGSSVYSLSCVLSIFLLGLALGAWIAARLSRFIKQPLIALALIYMFCASYIVAVLYFADELPWTALSLGQFLGSLNGSFSFWQAMASRAAVAFLVVFFPAVAMGTVVPLLFNATGLSGGRTGGKVGAVYAANTAGAIAGACLTGFVLIPLFSRLSPSGIQTAILLAACGQMALAAGLCAIWFKSFIADAPTQAIVNTIVFLLIGAVIADICCFRPSWNQAIMSAGASFYSRESLAGLSREKFLRGLGVYPGSDRQPAARQAPLSVLYYREGLNTTVTAGSDPARNVIYLKNDGKVEAAVPLDPQLPCLGGDERTQILLGALPVLFHNGQVRKAFVIGYGTGTTAGAIASFPEVENLTVCELEKAVLDADYLFQSTSNNPLRRDWLDSGKVQVLNNDARYSLASSSSRFDLITSQPADPWVAGSSELFTREFFQLASSRLKENGIFCQWIQLYSLEPEYLCLLLQTFQSVFPDAELFLPPGAGEAILLGRNSNSGLIAGQAESLLGKRLQVPAVSRLLERAGAAGWQDVFALRKLSASQLGNLCRDRAICGVGARLNTDDNLQVEFAAARSSMTQDQRIGENIRLIERFAAARGTK